LGYVNVGCNLSKDSKAVIVSLQFTCVIDKKELGFQTKLFLRVKDFNQNKRIKKASIGFIGFNF